MMVDSTVALSFHSHCCVFILPYLISAACENAFELLMLFKICSFKSVYISSII